MGVAMVCMMCTLSGYEGPGDILPIINKTKYKRYLHVVTIGQQAHLDVNSTKVNQANKLKACLNFTLINAFTMYVLLSSNLSSFLHF